MKFRESDMPYEGEWNAFFEAEVIGGLGLVSLRGTEKSLYWRGDKRDVRVSLISNLPNLAVLLIALGH